MRAGNPNGSELTDSHYPPEVVAVDLEGRRFVLVGAAHISRESADLARQVIEAERPDCVCLELDPQRYAALSQKQRFESLDLKEIIRRRQLAPLIMNLILAAYQHQLGGQLGVLPGTEQLEAARLAQERGIPVALCDREVRVTLRRAWGTLSLWRKLGLLVTLMGAMFEKPELTEDDLRELRQQDIVSRLMRELGDAFPALKRVLIDERDTYLTEKMRQVAGRRIVAVVGAGHVSGIRAALPSTEHPDLLELETVPPASRLWKVVGWGIPVLILGAIAVIGWQKGGAAAGHNVKYWVLANGIPSMLAAIVAFGHPATVLTAFVAAPFTSLTPLIGAGYVAAFVQAYVRPPRVYELRGVLSQLVRPGQWWRNRLLRIFLVFLLVSLGSAIGTFVGGAEIVSNLF